MSENQYETDVKATCIVPAKKDRTSLFLHLDAVLSLASGKIKFKGNSDRAKLSYGRLLCQAVSCYGDLLKDVDLEEIEIRLTKLESQQENEFEKYK